MKRETYKGRKLQTTKGTEYGYSRAKINGVDLGHHLGNEEAAMQWMKNTIDFIDREDVNGGRWAAHWYVPGTYELCENDHPKTIGGECLHSYCVSLRPAPVVDEPAEKPAPVAPELPAGTRVTTSVGKYAGQTGTVQERNRGTVTNTESENFGRAYVSVKWDGTPQTPWGEFFRPFADELTIVDTPAPAICIHGGRPRPDVTGDPIKACANSSGGVDYGAFNDEGCFYAHDCAVDVANESAQENEDAADEVSTWGEMCRDHRDQEQPKDGCEECAAEPDEDHDRECPTCGAPADETGYRIPVHRPDSPCTVDYRAI